MNKSTRDKIKQYIDETTDYAVDSIVFHQDRTVSGVLDANKTFNGPHSERLIIGDVHWLAAQCHDA